MSIGANSTGSVNPNSLKGRYSIGNAGKTGYAYFLFFEPVRVSAHFKYPELSTSLHSFSLLEINVVLSQKKKSPVSSHRSASKLVQ